jgi:hypothetical protein
VASVTTVVRLLGLRRSRWRRVGPESVWSAARPVLVGVWGWVGLAVAIWLTITATSGSDGPRPGLVHTLAIAGIAHAPVVALGMVVFVSAGVLDHIGHLL